MAAALALAFLAGCSGDKKGGTPIEPDPIVATTVAVQAGANQSAAAGSALPVAPSVLVRDQDGAPMRGVAVAFRVDSGGGQVTNATVTTGADGIASSGGWTIGSGRNVLRVTVGTLPPVFIIATSTVAATIASGPITAAGGTVTVTRPGDPLDGMSVVVPAGVASGPVTLSIAVGDTVGMPRRAGLRMVSPVITLSTSAPLTDSLRPIRITLPAVTTASEVPVAMLFNRTTRDMIPLPTVRLSATQVGTIAPHIDGAKLDGSGTTASGRVVSLRGLPRAQSANTLVAVQLVIGVVNESALNTDITTGFTPGTDDWEFDNALTAFSSTQGGQDRMQTGLAATAAWYFDRFKPARGSLNGRFEKAPGVEWSNPAGLALVKQAAEASDPTAALAYESALKILLEQVSAANRPTLDSLILLAVKAGMYTTGKPYVLLAHEALLATTPVASLLVYASRGSTLSVTTGTAKGGSNAPRTLTLANGRFPAVTWGVRDPETDAVTTRSLPNLLLTGISTGLPASTLNTLWQSLFNNTISLGNVSFELASTNARNIGDTLFIADDTTRVWVECTPSPDCAYSYPVTGPITPRANVAAARLYRKEAGASTWTAFNTVLRGNGTAATDNTDGATIGLVLVAPLSATQNRYGGWKQFVVKAKRLRITPAPLRPAGGNDFTITATYDRPLPPSPSWVWSLGDGRTLTTTVNTLTTQYAGVTVPTTRSIKVTLRSGASTVEAIGRTTAVVQPPLFGWALRTASVSASTLPQGGIGILRSDTTVRDFAARVIGNLTATPANSAIFVAGIANGGANCDAVAMLQQAPSAATVADSIIDSQFVGILGTCGDPDMIGNLTMGQLGNGTIIGTAAEGSNQNVIVPPGGSINATMAARNLTGSFVWNVRYSTGIATYTVTFTAVQVRPQ